MSEKLYKLFIGLNDKNTKTQLITISKAKQLLTNCLLQNNIKRATIYQADGIYTHNNGEVVNLLFIDYETVIDFCNALKVSLNQESIALQQIELTKCELV